MSGYRVLTRMTSESRVPPEQRIYVNRNLRMSSVRAIGFDLDHTLAHYRGRAVEELAYRLTQERLVERYGYPERLLEIAYDPTFVIRGLVVDKRRGHILKMDCHNYVARAYHGRRALSAEERKTVYRNGRVRLSSANYVSVDTLFHLPEVFLYAVLVDMKDERLIGPERNYESIYADVREAIDSIHGDGTLKARILAHPGRFVRRDPRLVPALEEFRLSGKKLFLLTNSEYYYSAAILAHLIENGGGEGARGWGSYFDLIVVEAQKPGYFVDLDRSPAERQGDPPEGSGPVVHGGNARLLERTLGFTGDEILYFGDHTYGDILRSKKTLGWRTAMVVEELGEELAVTRGMKPQIEEFNHLSALRGVLESDLGEFRRQQLRLERRLQSATADDEPTRARLVRRVDLLQTRVEEVAGELAQIHAMTAEAGAVVDRAYNPFWGPLFREDRETSRFGDQVRAFACIYTTRVSNFINYHTNHYFRSAEDQMPHEIGV